MSSQAPQHEGEIQRFGWVLGADGEHGGIDRRDDGAYVRFEDHNAALFKAEAGAVAAEARAEKLERGLAIARADLEDLAKRSNSAAEATCFSVQPEGDRE